MIARYTLAAGVHVVQTRPDEVAYAGGPEVLVLEGHATTLMALCRSFAGLDGATVDEAVAAAAGARDDAERERLRGGLTSIVTRMIDGELLVPVEHPRGLPYPSLVIAAPHRSPLVARLMEIAGYEIREECLPHDDWHPSPADSASLLVAWNLSPRHLYTLNDAALGSGTPWMFVAQVRETIVVSPVIRPGQSACYACLRFRCLGALPDPMAAGAIESAVIDGQPIVSGRRRLSVHEEFLAASALVAALGATARQPDAFRFVQASGAVEIGAVLRLPNCPVCLLR